MIKGHIVKFKAISLILIIVLLCTGLLACGSEEKKPDYLIAYTNSTNDDVEYYQYFISEDKGLSERDVINDLITRLLIEGMEDGIHYSPLPDGVNMNDFQINNGLLTIDFDSGYNTLTNVQELILKACVVLTMAQVDSVDSILFTVDGSPVKDSKGNEIGPMNPESYVDILLSDEELLVQETEVVVYYTDKNGEKLHPYVHQVTLDNQTQSLEEYIVRKLIEGPDGSGGFPTMDPSVGLINVMTTEHTCFVNFNNTFLEQNQTVSDDIMIYSIVNSLTQLAFVNNVQILVDGRSDVVLHRSFDLSKPLSRNTAFIGE